MEASSYALVQGVRSTRATLESWNSRSWRVVGTWVAGSLCASLILLAAVWAISGFASPAGSAQLGLPPMRVGDLGDVWRIFFHNSLVLALHAMACVAGFIAGSSLPQQAQEHRGVLKLVHERGGRLAILFVCAATAFSLCAQAYVLGVSVTRVSFVLHTSPGILLLGLLPHALVELTALFLPLAAWILASRRGAWDELLAATVVTVAISVPVVVLTALWEVYVAPHVLHSLIAY